MASKAQVTHFDEINITPLTDIFLVLLIIMMVVAPMMSSQRKEVKLPALASGQQVQPNQNTVEVLKDGSLFFAGEAVTVEQLPQALKKAFDKTKEGPAAEATGTTATEQPENTPASSTEAQAEAENAPVVVLRGDKEARAKVILTVLDAARDAGFSRVMLAGDAAQAGALPETEASPPSESAPSVPQEGY